MFYNYASVIITNLFFFKIDTLLQKISGSHNISYSPIIDCPSRSVQIQMCLFLKTHTQSIDILIAINKFSYEEFNILRQYFADIIHNLNITFYMIFKKNINISFEQFLQKTIYTTKLKELDISINNAEDEKSIQLFIPYNFFKLFSNSISSSTSAESIENEVMHYFRNPQWMFPDIQYLFSVLTIAETTKIINILQRKNLLTPYQVFLIINAFPELSGLIKSALSQNCIDDVIQLKNNPKGLKINKRDIAGGIYSVEESIFMLMKDGIDLSYSVLLRHMQSIVQMSLTGDLLLKQHFSMWLSEIESQDLLYATISITEDAVISTAISRDARIYLPIFRKYVTERKIEDIQKLLNPAISYDKIMKARIRFISNYRNLKMKRIQARPERLEYLLSAFTNPNDYQYLLLSVGWFTLSTALKGLHKKIITSVLDHLPITAHILIEDVLKGIVNPNILHDEMQINKARIQCVSSIMQLYNDGFINLE